MKTLTIIGRRWFRRGYGGTYHTSQIIIDGKTVGKTLEQYGYGDQYIWTAFEYMAANNLLPEPLKRYSNGGSEAIWQYCERLGITYTAEAIDVPREKDL